MQTYTLMTEQEATDRIEACHTAFLEWRKLTHQERAPFLTKIGQKLRGHADELAALTTRETGKLLKDGHLDVEICTAICDFTDVRAFLARTACRIHLIQLPPYCPHLNPIERLWAVLHQYGLCCTIPMRDSSCESGVVAGLHEQTHISRLQDRELARIQ